MTKTERRKTIEGYLFISPVLIGLCVFILGPMIVSFVISFFHWDAVSPAKWAGISNYKELVTDPLFWQALKVTSTFALFSIPLQLIFALTLAILLNQKIKGLPVFRLIYFMLVVTSGVAVALLWRWIFNPVFGVINLILSNFGIQGPLWLVSRTWALPALIIMSLWTIGGTMIIFLAGLQGIPNQLYEAATVDGANWWRKFWAVTIPILSPVIFFNLIMGIIASFRIFTQVFIMTGGGPANATLFYILYLYRNGFQWFRMGYASTLAWALFFIVLALTLLVFKSSGMWVYYEGMKKR